MGSLRGQAVRFGTRCHAKQDLPDLRDRDAVLWCYQWERTSEWEADGKHLDAEASWWLGTRSFLFVGLFLPCCSDHEARALGGRELQRLHLANKSHEQLHKAGFFSPKTRINTLFITKYKEGMMLESQAGWGVGQETWHLSPTPGRCNGSCSSAPSLLTC